MVIAGVLALAALATLVVLLRRRLATSERERARAAEELSRRLSELFSLQEVSYMLSDSLQVDRIVDQIVRYAMRVLKARGALIALTGETPADPLRVAGAEGTLGVLAGRTIAPDDAGLIARSAGSERLELERDTRAVLVGDVTADAVAALPLRAHGLVLGTLVIAEPADELFAGEHVRLLSTVATQAAAALANARFFGMVERAKLQWETAFDALSEGIAVVDEEGRMRRVNRALADLLGRPIPQVLGNHLCDALLGRSLALMQLLDQARRGERPPPLLGRSEATGRTFRITAARIQPASAGQTVVVLVEDVTDQRALEAQLIQSEKLAAVGQLVSGVAHELNNPLTSITGLSEFLLEQTAAGNPEREHLQVVHEQAERAGRIVRNLLTFARKGPTERTRVDLNDVVQRTVLLISYDLRLKDVAVRTELAAGLPDVLGERHALQQVVLNLLTNAAQAVETNAPPRPRDIVVATWADDRVHLRVRDTGPGIPDHVLPHVFTPFFTTKEPGHGTGLGLSISYSIVQGHGGAIAVERPPDGGTAFQVDLPPAGADAPAALRTSGARTPVAAVTPSVAAAPRSILLVDDDPAVRRVVEALFAQDGHTVRVADAADALALAASGAWDLVIAGGLAVAGGRLFVEELLERNPAVRDRVLVVTGDVRPAATEALARLSLPYLRKPFTLRELRAAAARVWTPASAL